MIGSICKLLVDCLGNPAGTKGLVIETYPDFDDNKKLGITVLFPNGNLDGFSIREQRDYLEIVNLDERYADYIFKSVVSTSVEFRNGFFDSVFK